MCDPLRYDIRGIAVENQKSCAKKITKLIRIITLAPVMALATLVTLFIKDASLFGGVHNFVLAVTFLGVLPLLAYPLQPIIPHFKDKGREGQRTLAMIFAVCGYILGCIMGLIVSATPTLWFIYLEYLISGALIMVFNKVLGLRASAHACGVIGPAVMLAYFGVPWALIPGIALYALAFWASVKMERHTASQFIGGAIIPVAVLIVLAFIFKALA